MRVCSIRRVEWIVWRESLLGRDVSTGVTGTTAVAPKFLNTLTLIGMREVIFHPLSFSDQIFIS